MHFQGNITESVRGLIDMRVKVSEDSLYKRLYLQRKREELTNQALYSKEIGISEKRLGESDIIVSLTSYGKRIPEVHVAIESIMQGSVKPNKIVLWLSENYRNQILPITIQKQIERGLDVEYCRDIRSYTKLIPTLKKYPDSSIITIDDDIIYPFDTIENLVNSHLDFPEYICANFVRGIPPTLAELYVSFVEWPILHDVESVDGKYFFEGFGGVLYPPHSLDREVFSEETFMDICKYADDVWFNAMALKANTKVKYAWNHYGFFPYVVNETVQKNALSKINNSGEILNDSQIKAVYGKYLLF